MAKRFASHTENEILDKRSKYIASSTEKANKRAGNLLREYLSEKNEDTHFEQYSPGRLNDVLKHFYLDAHKPDGETRGAENMDKMTKDTFIVKTDPKTKTKYVTKEMDEVTKNHRFNDKENVTAIMPEQPDSPSCPVAAFQKYISKLHPKCNRLWQRPLGSFCEDSATWYCNSPVGRDTLGQFMNKLSKLCSLSQVYTNHSI
ncbi:KCTD1_15 [Mytilus coruscus]|uniref:KCTD1_15 n=1 Tax=Mytilus coruscus TaxID=42192 RepID=A0A6J8DFI2_MYTCO|nr:KCTD1_15 [Mytilus coruscus]